MLEPTEIAARPRPSFWRFGLFTALALSALALLLAWVSGGFSSFQGWLSFLGALVVATGLLAAGIWLLRVESPPAWLTGLTVLAAILRLVLGAVWFIVLPVAGYHSPAEQGGYVMADADERDRAAWELGQSEKPLIRAFTSYRKADQYGGLLFFSAVVYRYLGASTHQPLLVVIFSAVLSALAVPFTWALARRGWGEGAARISAWGMAFYPEAVLLGSSQMREAFLVMTVAAAFYGLVRFQQDHARAGLAWIAGAILFSLAISPPVAALLLGLLVLQAVVMGRGLFPAGILHRRRFWAFAALLALGILVGMWFSWRQFAPAGINNPIAIFNWWLQKSAEWQRHLTEHASGWIQKIFDETPDWMNLPLLLVYGVVRPFLPAALIDITSTPVWYGIAVWRALGWTLLLPLLVYAPLKVFRKEGDRLARGLCVVVWIAILAASFRAGGDEWDNVRYRSAFAGLQVALGAWVITRSRLTQDAWLRRTLVGMALIVAWFFPWYLRRYLHIPWPVGSFYLTLGLGLLSAAVYILFDIYLRKKTT